MDKPESEYIDITPPPEFLEACRRVTGIDDSSPAFIIPLLRSTLAAKIDREHKRIVIAAEWKKVVTA
jgi:hypothetical protein